MAVLSKEQVEEAASQCINDKESSHELLTCKSCSKQFHVELVETETSDSKDIPQGFKLSCPELCHECDAQDGNDDQNKSQAPTNDEQESTAIQKICFPNGTGYSFDELFDLCKVLKDSLINASDSFGLNNKNLADDYTNKIKTYKCKTATRLDLEKKLHGQKIIETKQRKAENRQVVELTTDEVDNKGISNNVGAMADLNKEPVEEAASQCIIGKESSHELITCKSCSKQYRHERVETEKSECKDIPQEIKLSWLCPECDTQDGNDDHNKSQAPTNGEQESIVNENNPSTQAECFTFDELFDTCITAKNSLMGILDLLGIYNKSLADDYTNKIKTYKCKTATRLDLEKKLHGIKMIEKKQAELNKLNDTLTDCFSECNKVLSSLGDRGTGARGTGILNQDV